MQFCWSYGTTGPWQLVVLFRAFKSFVPALSSKIWLKASGCGDMLLAYLHSFFLGSLACSEREQVIKAEL